MPVKNPITADALKAAQDEATYCRRDGGGRKKPTKEAPTETTVVADDEIDEAA